MGDYGNTRGSYETKPPIEEGETFEGECISLGKEGDGVFRYEGYVVIVPNTKVGEKYTVKITATRKKVGFGEVA